MFFCTNISSLALTLSYKTDSVYYERVSNFDLLKRAVTVLLLRSPLSILKWHGRLNLIWGSQD